MYKVIKEFTDSQDNGYKYNVGDEFPRKGVEVNDYRIEKLSSDKNRQKTPLIAKKDLNLAIPAQPPSPEEKKVEQGAVPPIKKEGKPKVNNGRKKKEN